ncbi:HAD family hydrolase [Chryseobacterium arthrosphaerae]|uniref:HAD family hydrolase n=1 Tax=Chryseobacterium arthrosphaerae TaxID=651561 RepID=A0A3S0QSW2_9FLAO|nr:HAD family hydrolase [Chryseobacterium arthrosphaerae]
MAMRHLCLCVRCDTSGAKEMIEELKRSGVENIIMLTGDNPQTAAHVSGQLGITSFRQICCLKTKSRRYRNYNPKAKK